MLEISFAVNEFSTVLQPESTSAIPSTASRASPQTSPRETPVPTDSATFNCLGWISQRPLLPRSRFCSADTDAVQETPCSRLIFCVRLCSKPQQQQHRERP